MKAPFYLLLCAMIWMSSCQSGKEKHTVEGASVSRKLPDVAGFFSREVKALNEQHFCLEKQGRFNKQLETGRLSGKDLHWEEELAAFLVLDLNKAAWKDYLRGDTITLETGINRLCFVSQNPELGIDSIIVNQNEAGQMLGLQAWLDGSNELVSGKKILTAKISQLADGSFRLSSYEMVFSQKVILEEALTTRMVGVVLAPEQCR